jgi:glutaredoxin
VCGYCDLARLYLEKRKVPFTEKNLENNPALQQELKQKTGSLSVPAITIGDKVMNGYLESLLGGELDAAGYPKIGAPASAGDDASAPEDADQPAEQ